jgi:hypothetical protein
MKKELLKKKNCAEIFFECFENAKGLLKRH